MEKGRIGSERKRKIRGCGVLVNKSPMCYKQKRVTSTVGHTPENHPLEQYFVHTMEAIGGICRCSFGGVQHGYKADE